VESIPANALVKPEISGLVRTAGLAFIVVSDQQARNSAAWRARRWSRADLRLHATQPG
jgi:hypothetical protein